MMYVCSHKCLLLISYWYSCPMRTNKIETRRGILADQKVTSAPNILMMYVCLYIYIYIYIYIIIYIYYNVYILQYIYIYIYLYIYQTL